MDPNCWYFVFARSAWYAGHVGAFEALLDRSDVTGVEWCRFRRHDGLTFEAYRHHVRPATQAQVDRYAAAALPLDHRLPRYALAGGEAADLACGPA